MDNTNRLKRQLTVLDIESKKLRTITTDENKSITCFEDLSNEIHYEIFDYLDGYSLYTAFSNLNTRFQQLINSSLVVLKFSFNYESQVDMERFFTDIFIPNKHRIISLHLDTSRHIENFFQCDDIDSSLDRLESIILCSNRVGDLTDKLYYLQYLPCLYALTYRLHECGDDSNSDIILGGIYEDMFKLPNLKYFSLSVSKEDEINISTSVSDIPIFSNIEYLHINHDCAINSLVSILYRTPQLSRLECHKLIESDGNDISEESITYFDLKYVNIDKCKVEFDEFETFMKPICSGIQILYIQSYWASNTIEPNQWKRLILQNMPQLRKIKLICHVDIDDNDLDSIIHQFNSRFWIERQWKIGFVIDPENISYSINSKIEKLFDFDENMEITTNSSNQFSTPIDLLISNDDDNEWRPEFINQLTPILRAMRFTRLHTNLSQLSVDNLITIIGLLPHLDSLKVFETSLVELNFSSIKDEQNFQSVSMTNKITKVYQEMNIDFTEILIKLCPHLKCLQINCVGNEDVEMMVRFILMKTNTHLQLLHLYVWNINDQTIDKLRKMIDSEKLISDYLIKRCGAHITLQWKNLLNVLQAM